MLYIEVVRSFGKVVSAKVVADDDDRRLAENRNDWRSYKAAQEVAAALGDGFIATDSGPYVSPRYDVIELPKVGDKVSYHFNGDHYPCGTITKISKGPLFRRIETDDANGPHVFWRRKLTGGWIKDGTWFLEQGHHNELNPSF